MYLNGRDAVNKENTTKKCNTRNPEMCERVKKKTLLVYLNVN